MECPGSDHGVRPTFVGGYLLDVLLESCGG
jgi:hypothetical protein